MKKKLIFTLICSWVISASLFSQSTTTVMGYPLSNEVRQSQGSEYRVRRTVTLENDSKSEEVVIKINEGTLDFNLSIESRISNGKLMVEIYDSAGKKQGNFTVETQLGEEKQEDVSGQYRKSWRNVPPGDWKVKILPTAASAKVMITSTFFSE